ncbi:MAG: alpha/beta hydrolase family protein, partial [Phycisphaerae bacterium]
PNLRATTTAPPPHTTQTSAPLRVSSLFLRDPVFLRVLRVFVVNRFSQLPRALAERSKVMRFGDIPVLLAHPDWSRPAPVVLWLHGRTVNKELDPGRYLRWIRAGIAACAIDLPGHGERALEGWDTPAKTLDVLDHGVRDIDRVIEALADPTFHNVFDLTRTAIGGMSLGGMTTLRRLCDPHEFVCAAVESTTGWLEGLYFPSSWNAPAHIPHGPVQHDTRRVAKSDASQHLMGFRPLPLLVLHSEADAVVAWEVQRRFIDMLRHHYTINNADPSLIAVRTWETTGAPQEHSGFGRVANDAKNVQVEFFTTWLKPTPPSEAF